ncbi:hypothetical protein GLOIN_2v1791318 [Rhizophagus irregularis DAOM 181602=DAOM 197198]|nr:hypothetical protein GLOIN_2v1791318 [Rhizophagus irregularis DAOM 181602=DAOM 197198]
MKSIKHQIFYFPEARIRLESLCELKCDTSTDSSYFYGLAQLCQYIQRLIIANVTKNYYGIAKLIEVQKNLKYFEWRDNEDLYVPGPNQDSYREILFALENNANNITHLNIYFIYISRSSQKILPKFHKLKTLITSFGSLDEQQLKMCVYRDLEIFKINHYNLKAASIIIENSGERLKKILLEPYELLEDVDNFIEDSLIFILIFDHTYEDSTYSYEEKNLKYGQELLKILINSTSNNNLKEIRFCGGCKFSLGALGEFFEKWEGRTLSIITSNYYIYEDEEYKELINKYKNNGIIKDFRCDTYTNVKIIIVNNINTENNNFGIAKLIEVQKNLKYFEWHDDHEFYGPGLNPYKEILLALEKKADIINHLEIFFLYTDRSLQKVLPEFRKLKTLIINDFSYFNEEQLKKCVYRDLETFRIEHYDLKENSIIIQNSGGHLKKILVDYCDSYAYDYYENFNEYSLILIQTDEKILENGKQVLNILIKSAPSNLKEIRFFDHIKFSLEDLEEFFGNWKGRSLSILTSDSLYEGDDYLKLINKYKNNGIIKSFRHECSTNVGDMDFKI